jgi:heme exporter protein D
VTLSPKVKPLAVGFVGALLAVLVWIVAAEIYRDHRLLHGVANWTAQQIQQQKAKPQ